MNMIQSLKRETKFLSHNRSVSMALLMAFSLSMVAVIGGVIEVERQHTNIEIIKSADEEDRQAVLSEQNSWGGAAYYGFHLTYDTPAPFAFAAMGQRDSQPWKHRIRMLALEGQIYERDANNPVIALIGRLDFSFFAAFILPIFIIVMLYDLRSSERTSGRFNLLMASDVSILNLWLARTLVISFSLFISVLLPLIAASIFQSVPTIAMLTATIYIAFYIALWTIISYWFASWKKSSSVILASLMAFWALVALIIPSMGRMAIDHIVKVPSGAEILLLQRETVNDAWDLPKQDTMSVFLKYHPEWSDYATIERPFEWKWYYAFQQVGDIKTKALSDEYRAGRLKRDRYAQYLSYFAPPALLERSFQKLAQTDSHSVINYELKVREFHAQLQNFYYPLLFKEEPFESEYLTGLPSFESD